MSHWKVRLREADQALARELSDEDAQRLRRTVLAAVRAAPSPRRWPLSFTVLAGSLAAASAALVVSTAIGSSPPPPTTGSGPAAAAESAAFLPAAENGERLQLQFATPGGTRIIWVFDAEFEMKGTLP
jgi:hypothetical protein